jgi:TetR/AcrR family transcriptional repressor of lmrAB and yxaGH operons
MNTTREQIVTAAARLLETQGYFGTGLNEVVRVSGAPKGVLYYYFPQGKEELTAAAIDQSAQLLAANMHAELGDAPGAGAAVDAICTFMLRLADYVEAGACRVGAPFAAVALETAGTSERLAAACRDAYALLVTVVAARLERGGWSQADAASLAAFVISAIEGGIVLARSQQSAAVIRQNATYMRLLLTAARPG